MTRFLRLALIGAFAGLALAAPAFAQFETPNRQFHDKTTFRLEGRHLAVPCESCHTNGVYKGTPTKCYDCHWVRRQDDRYSLKLGSQCEQCHRPVAWTAVRFDHGAFTGMPLSGAHAALACSSCHANNSFTARDRSCASCHLRDYQAARSPNHVAGGFPTTCETCHRASDTSFHQSSFNHQASFPLVGQHAQAACAACHKNNVYRGTPRDCVGCHRADYDRTTAPNHLAAGFPTTCETCHRNTDTGFADAGFNHAAFFPLSGRHAQAACAACHANNVYRGAPRDCVGCHRADYDRTTSPNHLAAGFSTACETCHRAGDASFGGAGFNHAAIFALVGRHAQIQCAACHKNNVYRGTSRDCVGCHRADYDRTTAPNHFAAGFSTACESCHKATDGSFSGASFNHASVFALVGRHGQIACAACHVNNVYKGTERTCVGCHRANYDRTTSPNHFAAGFSTTCETCHRATDSSWSQGTFSHRFPITGRHNAPCATCHQNTASYKVFTCLVCHEHSQSAMDREHRGRNGYRYDSLACYGCHPTGRAD